MPLREMDATCRACATTFRAVPKRSFLGFQRLKCPGCTKDVLYPLTSGYRITYWVLVVLMFLSVIDNKRRDRISYPGFLGIAVIVGLVRDKRIRKEVAGVATGLPRFSSDGRRSELVTDARLTTPEPEPSPHGTPHRGFSRSHGGPALSLRVLIASTVGLLLATYFAWLAWPGGVDSDLRSGRNRVVMSAKVGGRTLGEDLAAVGKFNDDQRRANEYLSRYGPALATSSDAKRIERYVARMVSMGASKEEVEGYLQYSLGATALDRHYSMERQGPTRAQVRERILRMAASGASDEEIDAYVSDVKPHITDMPTTSQQGDPDAEYLRYGGAFPSVATALPFIPQLESFALGASSVFVGAVIFVGASSWRSRRRKNRRVGLEQEVARPSSSVRAAFAQIQPTTLVLATAILGLATAVTFYAASNRYEFANLNPRQITRRDRLTGRVELCTRADMASPMICKRAVHDP